MHPHPQIRPGLFCLLGGRAGRGRRDEMATPQESLVKRAGSSEMDFLAEETMIEIEARFQHEALQLVRGTFGPFFPNQRAMVPLWLALTLKKQKKCRIVLPDWIQDDHLAEVLRQERAQEGAFQGLDFHYVEVANLLLKGAPDEFELPDRTRSLIEDIENVRMEKIRRGVQGMSDTVLRGRSVMSTKMNNVGAMEITTVRDFLCQAMNMFYVLSGQDVVDQTATRRLGGAGAGGALGGGSALANATAGPRPSLNGPPRKLRRYRGDAPSETTAGGGGGGTN